MHSGFSFMMCLGGSRIGEGGLFDINLARTSHLRSVKSTFTTSWIRRSGTVREPGSAERAGFGNTLGFFALQDFISLILVGSCPTPFLGVSTFLYESGGV